MLIINSNNFLTSSHLACTREGFQWKSELSDANVFAEEFPELAAIFGKKIDPLIPDYYANSAKQLNIKPPWCFYIGKQKYLNMVEKYKDQYFDFIDDYNEKLISIHAKINYFLRKLQPCVFNNSLIDSDLSVHFQKSLQAHYNNGVISVPKYIRTKTKTGRLSVLSGPNVLNMHAGLRKGVVDGVSIDFVSMEPNFLLAYQGREPLTNLYETVREELFENKISRAKVKIATMAALYGSGRSDKLANKISEFFSLDQMINTLENKIKNDTIKNAYDRLLNLNGARGRYLLALWLQSSAADGALYGFYNFDKNYQIIPYWIIHDGLIFIYKGKPENINELDVGLGFKLPVKVEKL
tara:strand:- start:2812 stop:3870 length:1059 start_codon:yes stop_codon:yes gene_type:complete